MRLKLSRFVMNVLPRFEWQTEISQSTRTDYVTTPLFRPPFFFQTIQNNFLSVNSHLPKWSDWSYKSERENKSFQIRGVRYLVGVEYSRSLRLVQSAEWVETDDLLSEKKHWRNREETVTAFTCVGQRFQWTCSQVSQHHIHLEANMTCTWQLLTNQRLSLSSEARRHHVLNCWLRLFPCTQFMLLDDCNQAGIPTCATSRCTVQNWIELVSWLVFWAKSTKKGYIMAKNNVQSGSHLLCTQTINKPQNQLWHKLT